ncbi:hypothetical protein POL68_26640 [Stigmatella sp. ncwal1]|uniref:Uncharacterized protein n=1 Tax=Stigmatella ashevillensis TaxID=2995309 RepID=A0ABT5DG68_9BACT|nr:hypothetical protein [Stigmatella ashevillena]MDC0712074.1 hypothetical protein [Stigmatella ashevillena]
MRKPEHNETIETRTAPSSIRPITTHWFNQPWQIRPEVLLYSAPTPLFQNLMLWSPLQTLRLKAAIKASESRRADERLQGWIYQNLTQYAGLVGTSHAYGLVLSLIQSNYNQIAQTSSTGRAISSHSMSMMETFRKASSSVLPSFSLALSNASMTRVPSALPSSASVLDRVQHHFASVSGYTAAHNDAYRDIQIDRHFTPAWLTELVLIPKILSGALLPSTRFAPVNALYGAANAGYGMFTGHMALTFNPAQDYSHSDFAKRTALYAGVFAMVARAVPKFAVYAVKAGPWQFRLTSVATSLLFGGTYEFYCGVSAGTGYFKKPLKHITFIEEDDGKDKRS